MNTEAKAGTVVRSAAGHDKGGLFVVLDAIDDAFVWIADGKTRTVEKPKKKKRRHLRAANVAPMQFSPDALPINAEIRRFLKACESKL